MNRLEREIVVVSESLSLNPSSSSTVIFIHDDFFLISHIMLYTIDSIEFLEHDWETENFVLQRISEDLSRAFSNTGSGARRATKYVQLFDFTLT